MEHSAPQTTRLDVLRDIGGRHWNGGCRTIVWVLGDDLYDERPFNVSLWDSACEMVYSDCPETSGLDSAMSCGKL